MDKRIEKNTFMHLQCQQFAHFRSPTEDYCMNHRKFSNMYSTNCKVSVTLNFMIEKVYINT